MKNCISLSVSLSDCLSICMSVCLSVCLCLFPSLYLKKKWREKKRKKEEEATSHHNTSGFHGKPSFSATCWQRSALTSSSVSPVERCVCWARDTRLKGAGRCLVFSMFLHRKQKWPHRLPPAPASLTTIRSLTTPWKCRCCSFWQTRTMSMRGSSQSWGSDKQLNDLDTRWRR